MRRPEAANRSAASTAALSPASPPPPASPPWLVAFWTWAPALLPLLIGVLGAASASDPVESAWWLIAGPVTAGTIGLRFRWPWTTLLVALGVVVTGMVESSTGVYVLLVGVTILPLVAVAATARPRDSALAAIGTTVVVVLVGAELGSFSGAALVQSVVFGLGVPAISIVAAWLVGYALFVRRRYADALLERAQRLERERDAEAARAVAEERTRIARELHDVVSHNVAVMVVQAGAADAVWDSDPTRAREALRAVEETGRSAMGELRVMLQAMRGREAEVEGAERQAQPGLARLPAVLEQVRQAGVEVRLAVEGDLATIPTIADLSLLRVAQEAMTNVLRHARASSVEVVVVVGPEAVALTVADDGIGLEGSREVDDPLDPMRRGGHGLVGMRERVAALDGTIAIEPAPNGGTTVAVHVPLSRQDGR